MVDQSTTERQALAVRFRELQRDPIRRRDELLTAGVDYSRSLVDDDPLLAFEVADWSLGLMRAPAAPEDTESAVALAELSLVAAREVAPLHVVSDLVDRCLSLIPDPSPFGIDPVEWILLAAEADRRGGRLGLSFERLEEALEHADDSGRSDGLVATMTSAIHSLAAGRGPEDFVRQLEHLLMRSRRPPADRALINVTLAALAQARLSDGDVRSAELFVRQIDREGSQLPPAAVLVGARAALDAANPVEAKAWLDGLAADLAASDRAVDPETDLHLLHVRAETAVELGDDDDGRPLVNDLIRRSAGVRGPEGEALLARAQTLLAELQHRQGNAAEAYQTLRAARELANGNGRSLGGENNDEIDLRDGSAGVTVRAIRGVGLDDHLVVSLVDAPGRFSSAGRLLAVADSLRSEADLDESQIFVEVLDTPGPYWEQSLLDAMAAMGMGIDRVVLYFGDGVIADISETGREAILRIRDRGAWIAADASPAAIAMFLDGERLLVDLCVIRMGDRPIRAGVGGVEPDVADSLRALMVSLGAQVLADGVDDDRTLERAIGLGAHAVRGSVVSPVLPTSIGELSRRLAAGVS